MPDSLISQIAEDIKSLSSSVLLIENNDGFLFRDDVVNSLRRHDIEIVTGSMIKQRVAYELRKEGFFLVLLQRNRVKFLEDIESCSKRFEFFLDSYMSGFHIQSIKELDLSTLDHLFLNKPIVSLTKAQTLKFIAENREKSDTTNYHFNIDEDMALAKIELNNSIVDWKPIALRLGKIIAYTIGTTSYHDTIELVNQANEQFQIYREGYYAQTKASNPTKHPKNVNKILDHLSFKYKDEKVALVVVDGLSLWQYQLFANRIQGKVEENITLSWIPSITQLSRQAIFRGSSPEIEYSQNPRNEEKLWFEYWTKAGISKPKIQYQYENFSDQNLGSISKLAIVYKDLDEYMHGNCKDYEDLKDLTENWIKRSEILSTITQLTRSGFNVFITSDHGNVEATGWRGLTGREKLGTTNKSGSKSQRHLEYSEQWLYDEFVESNPELEPAIVREERAIYFKNNQSFSKKEELVTHGGAHLLEVVIPFIKISSEE